MRLYRAQEKEDPKVHDNFPAAILEMENGPVKRFTVLLYVFLVSRKSIGEKATALAILEKLRELPPNGQKIDTSQFQWTSRPGELSPIAILSSLIREIRVCLLGCGQLKHIRDLQALCRIIAIAGDIPNTLQGLFKLPGPIIYTWACTIMEVAWDRPSGIPLGLPGLRVLGRLGWIDKNAYWLKNQKLRNNQQLPFCSEIENLFRRPTWRYVAPALNVHGKQVCLLPLPNCGGCILNRICPSSSLLMEEKLAGIEAGVSADCPANEPANEPSDSSGDSEIF